MRGFFKRKVVDPVLNLLKQGISPEKIALGMAVGVVLSIFPVIGVTTLMCLIAAIALRLNLPAVQIVNYLVYPLQIVLLIPFFHLGAWIFGVEPLPLSGEQLITMFQDDFWGSFRQLWDTTMRAIVAWCLLCLPAMAGLYYLLVPIIRRLKSPPAGRSERKP